MKNGNRLLVWLIVAVLGLAGLGMADEGKVVRLWEGVAPGSEGIEINEKWVDRGKEKGIVDRQVSQVHRPDLTVYLPSKGKATGAAVVICPGGGYNKLAIDKEGHDIARWLNTIGVAGFVLKYRLPRSDGHVYGHRVPLMDAQRAIRLIRSRSKEWRIDPERIGIMGFSAGGHLASTAGTHFDKGNRDAKDPVERVSCRPDFMILAYPVVSFIGPTAHQRSRKQLLGDDPEEELVKFYSNELQVTEATPPAFLVHTSDDHVKVENSIGFYMALREVGVACEMHIYVKGGHGYGLGVRGGAVASWPERCAEWMGE